MNYDQHADYYKKKIKIKNAVHTRKEKEPYEDNDKKEREEKECTLTISKKNMEGLLLL